MSRVREAQAFFDGMEGRVVECVENTYRPELNGERRRVTKVGRSYVDAVSLRDGKPMRLHVATRASEVVSVSEDEATFRLGSIPRLQGHTVTYRKVVGDGSWRGFDPGAPQG